MIKQSFLPKKKKKRKKKGAFFRDQSGIVVLLKCGISFINIHVVPFNGCHWSKLDSNIEELSFTSTVCIAIDLKFQGIFKLAISSSPTVSINL